MASEGWTPIYTIVLFRTTEEVTYKITNGNGTIIEQESDFVMLGDWDVVGFLHNKEDALEAVADFQKAIDKLPNLDMITEEQHGETIDTMYNYYNEIMDKKAKNLMDKNYVTSLLQYVNRIDDIRQDDHRTFKKTDEV
jgi:hypothetical protein